MRSSRCCAQPCGRTLVVKPGVIQVSWADNGVEQSAAEHALSTTDVCRFENQLLQAEQLQDVSKPQGVQVGRIVDVGFEVTGQGNVTAVDGVMA